MYYFVCFAIVTSQAVLLITFCAILITPQRKD